MGALGGLLGIGNSNQVNSGTNQGQLQGAYNQNQAAMQGQQGLLNALQAQGGLGNQSQVYNQLQGVVSGQGPNPAQAMLNQATGQNVANQAALMAGQRGAGANVGLMARQAAQQGANLQQQAAGQGATMQAQQALGALGQAGNMANQMAGQQIGQTNINQQAAQGLQNTLLNANQAANQTQAGLQQTAMGGIGKLVGGGLNALTGGASAGGANGGEAGKDFGVANGGIIPGGAVGPKSMLGKSLLGVSSMAKGGNVGSQLKHGGHVPGQAKVKGDSEKNDNVKALLSPGEVVIPRSVMNSKNPIKGSAEFVRAVLAKKGKRA